MKLNLQLFAGSLTVTVYKDANITTATADPASSLAKDDEVTLEIAPASGKELDEIEVIAGGVEIDYSDPTDISFTMGESNVILFVKGKKDNLYKITEETEVIVNGTKTLLKRNMIFKYGTNGALIAVETTPTAVTITEPSIIAGLIESGVLIKA